MDTQTPDLSPAILRANYTHEGMIDLLVANPGITQRALAAHFGYTEGWVSRVMASDAFKARLSARRAEIVDPAIVSTVEERFEALARRSADLLMEKLDSGASGDLALRTLEITGKALGYGARGGGTGVTLQQNFVVAMPPKSPDPSAWIESYAPPLGERKRVAEIKDALRIPASLPTEGEAQAAPAVVNDKPE